MREEDDVYTNRHSDLGRLHFSLQWHMDTDPRKWFCSSAEQSKWLDLVRKLGGLLYLIQVPN